MGSESSGFASALEAPFPTTSAGRGQTGQAGGDTVVFYIKSPVASFVASGQVLDDHRVDGARYGRSGQMGKVGKIKMLPHEVHLRDARDATPGWG
jgi:hypothetical protein